MDLIITDIVICIIGSFQQTKVSYEAYKSFLFL